MKTVKGDKKNIESITKTFLKKRQEAQALYSQIINSKQDDYDIPKDKYIRFQQDLKLFMEAIKGMHEFMGAVYIAVLYKPLQKIKVNDLHRVARIIRKESIYLPLNTSTLQAFKPYFSNENNISKVLLHLMKAKCLTRDTAKSVTTKKGVLILDIEKIRETYYLPVELIKHYIDKYFCEHEGEFMKAGLLQDTKTLKAKSNKLNKDWEQTKELILRLY